jgi:hypothetical protein
MQLAVKMNSFSAPAEQNLPVRVTGIAGDELSVQAKDPALVVVHESKPCRSTGFTPEIVFARALRGWKTRA